MFDDIFYPSQPKFGMVMEDSLERLLRPNGTCGMATSPNGKSNGAHSIQEEGVHHSTIPCVSPEERTLQWVYSSSYKTPETLKTSEKQLSKDVEMKLRTGAFGHGIGHSPRTFPNTHSHTSISGMVQMATIGPTKDGTKVDPLDLTNYTQLNPFRQNVSGGNYSIGNKRYVISRRKATATVTSNEESVSASMEHARGEQYSGLIHSSPGPTTSQSSTGAESFTGQMFELNNPKTQNMSPIPVGGKDILKKHILQRNPEAQPLEIKIKEEKLEAEDLKRRARRRERNRIAAQKCRSRKTEKADTLFKQYQEIECSNTDLRYQIKLLERERDKLTDILVSHQKSNSCHKK